MTPRPLPRALALAAATVAICAIGGITAAPANAADDDGTLQGAELYRNPYSTTLEAAQSLSGQARADAQLLGSIPSADWITKGTPAEAQAAVDEIVDAAAALGQVPTLVVYNLPFRDCSQYSAGGAADTAAYLAWVDGVAAGIGDRDAIVILEPDGLGIIPWNTDGNGNAEWCQPAELDPATAADERYVQVNGAVDRLTALAGTHVYLDGTHTGWLGVGDISARLIRAGVERTDGFFLNASNYEETRKLERYGTWISECIHLSQNSWWEPGWCGSQYYPANPADFDTWTATDATYDQAYADTGLTRDPAAQAHFVIDTSRNGQGPWTAPAGAYPDAEAWCNPPERGIGERPTTDTGDALIDAFLWIKVPGESDGKCYRGTGGPLDPERGIEDPAAGVWFPQQARELVALANPPIAAQTCAIEYLVHGTWPGGFNTQIWVKNTGTTAINGWELEWAFRGDLGVGNGWSADWSQQGSVVTASSLAWNAALAPGARTTIGFIGNGADPATVPWLFELNGAPCTS
ncbi:glycoside hydrolase family 6 protein [Agromyces larvae]|uniref:Glucanase n=1 Tax=Agromyces larvae TaxID=2929802 RepID=A0ABY4BZU0_9MICO|nr:glycoside hydrolase family 6 protein [Agromyces larvae]UOE43682.1 glycoside hydrolase family 6 protein [Agromyces larvae]